MTRAATIACVSAGFAALAVAQPTTAPTTRPADSANVIATSQPTTVPASALPQLVQNLADRDPDARAQARDALMRLRRDDLSSLAAAARGQPLLPTQRSLLHDIVVHVYLTGEHNFEGDGAGYLGITGAGASVIEEPDVPDANAQPDGEPKVVTRRGAVVQTRVIGCDAYRVLEVGDVITAVARPEAKGRSRSKNAGQFTTVRNFTELRGALMNSHTGEWIGLKILRNGQERELGARLSAVPTLVPGGNSPDPPIELGESYWQDTFEPAMSGATTMPTTARSSHPNSKRDRPRDRKTMP